MDAIDGASSDVEESQATQMLIDLIPRGSSIADPLSPVPATKIQSPLPPDVTAESFASSRHSNSLPTYHYHGLASTQTQTQTQGHDEDVEMQEGSQKENIQKTNTIVTTNDSRHTPFAQKVAPNASSSKATPSRNGHLEQIGHSRVSHSKTRTPNTRPVAINSLDSPSTRLGNTPSKGESGPSRKPPSRTLPVRSGKRKFSPGSFPEESQDSFAHDPLHNAEELFIAGNKLLQRPLSELGRVDSPEPEDFDAPIMDRSTGFNNPVMAKILVESSQSPEPTQIILKHYGDPSATSAPSGRSSPPLPSLDSSGGASCFEDGTQRSVEESFQTQPTQLVGAALIAATTASGDALHLVPDAYRPRPDYRGLDEFQETQPMAEEDLQPPRRPNFAMPSRSTHATAGSSVRARQGATRKSVGDAMMEEVIPDSEPPANIMSPMPAVQDESDEEGAVLPQPARSPAYEGKGKGRAVVQDDDTEAEDDELLLAKSAAAPARQEEEEDGDDDDDDDDLPLARKGKKGGNTTRGKKASSATPVAKVKAAAPRSVPSAQKRSARKPGPKAKETRSKAAAKAKDATPKAPAKQSSGSSFVPSSLPLQDYAPASSVKVEKAARKTTAKAPTKTPARPKRTTAKANYQEPPTDDEEVVEETEDPIRISPEAARSDDGTLPEEEEYDVEPAQGAGRKRKRGAIKPAVKQEPKNKRLRAGGSINWEGATRVYAFWAQTDTFYPGRIHSRVDAQTYAVSFDDGHDAVLPLEHIRKFELVEGDVLMIPRVNQFLPALKVNPEQELVTVKPAKRNQDTPWSAVLIPRVQIEKQWDNRKFEHPDEIVPMDPSAYSQTPSVVTVNSPRSKKPKARILAGTGVVITLHKACTNPRARKEELQGKVKAAGGLSMDDFFDHLKMDGTYDCGNDRWRISKRDVKWARKDISRLFLVSDAHNQKPRYLFAIALGIPCISGDWLDRCLDRRPTDKEPNWNSYLLPQATIEEFGNLLLSQQVDLKWGETPSSLINIMDNQAPSKLFKGASILCVGKDMLPVSSKPGEKFGNGPANNILPRIMLCMGADRVESVLTPTLASATLDKYTYIVTNTFDDPKPNWTSLPADKWVDWAWVRSCLLASRLLPRPDPPNNDPESQDI